MSDESPIVVVVGNYGYYGEGELRDKAIALPKTDKEIEAFLKDNGLKDADHEEIYVSECTKHPFEEQYRFLTQSTLEQLNVLAALILDNPDDAEKINQALVCGIDVPDNALEVSNLIAQADEISVNELSMDSMTSREEALGRYFVYECGESIHCENKDHPALSINVSLAKLIEDNPMLEHFDFEGYGRELALDMNIGTDSNGNSYFMFSDPLPEMDHFTLEQLKDNCLFDFGSEEQEFHAAKPESQGPSNLTQDIDHVISASHFSVSNPVHQKEKGR